MRMGRWPAPAAAKHAGGVGRQRVGHSVTYRQARVALAAGAGMQPMPGNACATAARQVVDTWHATIAL